VSLARAEVRAVEGCGIPTLVEGLLVVMKVSQLGSTSVVGR